MDERQPFINTGYATISRNILNGLSDEFDIHFMAHNLPSQTLPPGLTFEDGTKLNFTIHGSGRAAYCQDLIIEKINKIQPDIFGVLLDTFMLHPWITNYNFSPARSIFYYPSDGGGILPQGCENVLKHFNYQVAMARFGQRQVKEIHGFDTNYIPHAVDTGLFRPLTKMEKDKIKSEMVVEGVNGVKIQGFLKDKFVVGSVARNQGRKMMDRTIKAFNIFAKDKPNAVLYLHTDRQDAAAVFDISNLITRLGIENRVCFSPIKYFDNFEYKEMNKVYNAMDVFMLSTSGEGFGVPIIEAASCGIPQVITDYTTTHELLIEDGVCGIAVPMVGMEKTYADMVAEGKTFKEIDDIYTENSTITGSWAVERGLIDTKKCAEALTILYNAPEICEQMGIIGREKVLKFYDWKLVIESWRQMFRSMLQ